MTTSATAAGPTAGAAKKKKKKKFAPTPGLYTSANGKTRLRVILAHEAKVIRLFGAPPTTATCSNGTSRQLGIAGLGVTAPIKGKSFSLNNPNVFASFKGKFTSKKALKGSYTLHSSPVPGVTCTSASIAFKAKYSAK